MKASLQIWRMGKSILEHQANPCTSRSAIVAWGTALAIYRGNRQFKASTSVENGILRWMSLPHKLRPPSPARHAGPAVRCAADRQVAADATRSTTSIRVPP